MAPANLQLQMSWKEILGGELLLLAVDDVDDDADVCIETNTTVPSSNPRNLRKNHSQTTDNNNNNNDNDNKYQI